jgi:hypothetical protein
VVLMTVTIQGQVHRVTPGHLYWSVTRQSWHRLYTFRVGELVSTAEKVPVPIEAMAPQRQTYGGRAFDERDRLENACHFFLLAPRPNVH